MLQGDSKALTAAFQKAQHKPKRSCDGTTDGLHMAPLQNAEAARSRTWQVLACSDCMTWWHTYPSTAAAHSSAPCTCIYHTYTQLGNRFQCTAVVKPGWREPIVRVCIVYNMYSSKCAENIACIIYILQPSCVSRWIVTIVSAQDNSLADDVFQSCCQE